MRERRVGGRLAVTIAAAAIAWAAFGLQAWIAVPARHASGMGWPGSVLALLGSFTVLITLLGALTLTAALLPGRGGVVGALRRPGVTTAMTLASLVIGGVFLLMLRDLWPAPGTQRVADVLLRSVNPWSVFVWWLMVVPRHEPGLRSLAGWLLVPFAYFAATQLLVAITGSAPYFFIDPRPAGFARVAVNAAWIAAVFVIGGLMLMGFDRLKPRDPDGSTRSRGVAPLS